MSETVRTSVKRDAPATEIDERFGIGMMGEIVRVSHVDPVVLFRELIHIKRVRSL